MSYLSRLHGQTSGNGVARPLTEPTKGASVSSVSPRGGAFPQIDVSERASIIEFEAAVPRGLAEALARLEACPAWSTASRWQEIVDTFARMIDGGAAAQALASGWRLVEIIGIQVELPHDLPSRAGLVFSARPGDSIKNVRPGGCIIANGTVRHIWKRVPLPAGGSIVLPWQLGGRP
jgi:hypothetical protein